MTDFPDWPKLQPLSAERFRLEDDYRYNWEHEGWLYRLTVPAGFLHNMASTPRAVWWLISPFDLGPAAVPHDYGYHHRGDPPPGTVQRRRTDADPWQDDPRVWSRQAVDKLFARMMREAHVAKWRRRMAYRAVRTFGLLAWRRSNG